MKLLSRLFRRAPTKWDEGLLVELAGGKPPENWTPEDRWREFRAVFMSDERGRRVLWQILEWTRMYRTTIQPGDPYATYANEGGRNVGIRILATLAREPERKDEGTR